jgi:Mg2+ and Co2+ transporter CorA
VAVDVWGDDGPRRLSEAELRVGAADTMIRERRPIWAQLALPRLSSAEQAWFEGSVDPWDRTEAPRIDTSGVELVLERLGLAAATLDHRERELLDRLPHLYGRGVARVAREVWGRRAYRANDLRFFATVAFHPIEDTDPPSFWTMRMTVGVIRNVVITIRLPDLRWDEESEGFQYAPGEALDVGERFFPVADDLTADDVAEAIGLQQASTARAVSERVAAELRRVERNWRTESRDAGGLRSRGPTDARRVSQMTEQLYRLDRQLSRLLRRLELDGARSDGRSIASDIALRYRFALDELRSLEGNCRLATRAIAQAITTIEQDDRERFHFIAAALASSILVPTLVASIYGANVALPAEGSWRGFIALILFITAFALIGVFSISYALPRESIARMRWLRRRAVRLGAPIVAVTALACGVVAVT